MKASARLACLDNIGAAVEHYAYMELQYDHIAAGDLARNSAHCNAPDQHAQPTPQNHSADTRVMNLVPNDHTAANERPPITTADNHTVSRLRIVRDSPHPEPPADDLPLDFPMCW